MVASTPPASSNKMAGIFQYITKMDGSPEEVRAAQAKLAQLTPETQAIYQTLNMLPEGELKKWLMANPVQFWKNVIQLIKGRTFTKQQYTLGERLIDQIQGGSVTNTGQVSDDVVKLAQVLFTVLFGVRITTQDDLDALQKGIDAYRARPDKTDIPLQAINRAVFLKQNFYPDWTYNQQVWDLKYFEKYPLVAPIPGVEFKTLYNGELPGGAYAVNGLIPVNAKTLLSQYAGATIDPVTGFMQGIGFAGISSDTIRKYAPFIAILLVVGVIISVRTGLYKKFS
jgi:hypothetical protein